MRALAFFIGLWCAVAFAQPIPSPALYVKPGSSPALTISCPGTGSTSSTFNCTLTYTGTAPASATGAWNSTCSGSSTITAFTTSGGSGSFTASTPTGACAGTLTLTTNIPTSAPSGSVTISGGFVGLGDIQTGFAGFHSCGQAYSAAYAAANGKMCNLTLHSNSHSCDVLAASAGGPGNTANCSTGGDNGQSVFAWIPVLATANCTAAGTTLTCTGAVGTPVAGSPIAGAGIVQPMRVTFACSGGGGALTCSLERSQTVVSPVVVSFYDSVGVNTEYDQSGNSRDVTFSGTQPQLVAVGSGQPPVQVNNAQFFVRTSGVPSMAQPFTLSLVAEALPGASGEGYGLSLYDAVGSGIISFDQGGTANKNRLYCGSDVNVTATDGVFHSMNGVCNGASSTFNVDGSVTNTSTSTTASGTNALGIGAQIAGVEFLAGYVLESAFIAASPTGGTGAYCHNQWVRWSSFLGGSPPC